MEQMARRYREAMLDWMARAEAVERLAWWFVRYASDAEFRHAEERHADEATAGNVAAWEAQMDALLAATGRTTLPWGEAPDAGA